MFLSILCGSRRVHSRCQATGISNQLTPGYPMCSRSVSEMIYRGIPDLYHCHTVFTFRRASFPRPSFISFAYDPSYSFNIKLCLFISRLFFWLIILKLFSFIAFTVLGGWQFKSPFSLYLYLIICHCILFRMPFTCLSLDPAPLKK